METNSPADDPSPAPLIETPLETAAAPAAPEPADSPDPAESATVEELPAAADSADAVGEENPAVDELGQLAEASQKARLSQADEERMATLIREALLGGRSGVARAVEVLPRVPWIVGVRAVEAIWPELTAGFRTQMLSGLAKEETDAARRIRLSLARALFKLDTPVALKLAVAVARELRDKETGALTPKQAQIFANVFIGRGKPWLAQLPLADLKPADIDALVHCAVLAVFTLPHPPVTQLGVLKWTQEQERLGKLDAAALEALKKGLSRWSARWQGALRKEIAELPEEIIALLKPLPESAGAADHVEAGRSAEEEMPAEEGVAEVDSSVEREGVVDAGAGERDEEDEDEEDDDADDEEESERRERPVYTPRPPKAGAENPRERPVYTPRGGGGGGGGANVPRNFNLIESLRGIEAYANSLRADLAAAQAKLRQKDDRRRPEKSLAPIIEGEPTPEELARLNQQLEARNLELQERIKDLTQHSEDLATSMGAMSGEPVRDTDAQLRTLLSLKLQEDYADFLALKKETNDIVVQQHYRGVLEHVFEVLQQLEVPLKAE